MMWPFHRRVPSRTFTVSGRRKWPGLPWWYPRQVITLRARDHEDASARVEDYFRSKHDCGEFVIVKIDWVREERRRP